MSAKKGRKRMSGTKTTIILPKSYVEKMNILISKGYFGSMTDIIRRGIELVFSRYAYVFEEAGAMLKADKWFRIDPSLYHLIKSLYEGWQKLEVVDGEAHYTQISSSVAKAVFDTNNIHIILAKKGDKYYVRLESKDPKKALEELEAK